MLARRRIRISTLGVLAALLLAAAPVRADETAAADFADAPTVAARQPPLSHRIADNMSHLTNELGTHLSMLSFGLVDLNFDIRRHRAAVRLGGVAGMSPTLSCDVTFHGDLARIDTTIDLSLFSAGMVLRLPTLEMASQRIDGERSVEVRVPLYEGSF